MEEKNSGVRILVEKRFHDLFELMSHELLDNFCRKFFDGESLKSLIERNQNANNVLILSRNTIFGWGIFAFVCCLVSLVAVMVCIFCHTNHIYWLVSVVPAVFGLILLFVKVHGPQSQEMKDAVADFGDTSWKLEQLRKSINDLKPYSRYVARPDQWTVASILETQIHLASIVVVLEDAFKALKSDPNSNEGSVVIAGQTLSDARRDIERFRLGVEKFGVFNSPTQVFASAKARLGLLS